MNFDHGIYTETEKKLAFVNENDGPYITRLKVQSWRGEADYNYWTGQPGPHKRQQPKPAAPARPQQPLAPAEAMGVAIFWIGLIWFLSWLLG